VVEQKSGEFAMHPDVCIILHGSEATDLGGPSVRAPRTVEELTKAGITARSLAFPEQALNLPQRIVHIMNIWPHVSCLQALRFFRRLGIRTVLSPILLDHSSQHVWEASDEAPASRPATGGQGPYDLSLIARIFKEADHLVFLSQEEKALAGRMGLPERPHTLIRNPVDSAKFQPGPGDAFRQFLSQHASRAIDGEFVLSVGRLEPRKNQLTLIKALAKTDVTLVIVGHESHAAYAARCHAAASPNVIFTGRLPHEDSLLSAAYREASLYVHPSWSEGASIATLEAASSGCRLLLSDLPAAREYFGSLACYVPPDDGKALRRAILGMLEKGDTEDEAATRRQHVLDSYSYKAHVQHLSVLYRSLFA
jgi:glycosyltransferase involved in cell wall biosynthesis